MNVVNAQQGCVTGEQDSFVLPQAF